MYDKSQTDVDEAHGIYSPNPPTQVFLRLSAYDERQCSIIPDYAYISLKYLVYFLPTVKYANTSFGQVEDNSALDNLNQRQF